MCFWRFVWTWLQALPSLFSSKHVIWKRFWAHYSKLPLWVAAFFKWSAYFCLRKDWREFSQSFKQFTMSVISILILSIANCKLQIEINTLFLLKVLAMIHSTFSSKCINFATKSRKSWWFSTFSAIMCCQSFLQLSIWHFATSKTAKSTQNAFSRRINMCKFIITSN